MSINSTICKFKWALIFIPMVLIVLPQSEVFAQENGAGSSASNFSSTVKMGGVSPAVGGAYQLTNHSSLRALGFFTIDTSPGSGSEYLIDVSYLRNTDWSAAEDLDFYWGLNVNHQFNTSLFAPGMLTGVLYKLSNQFSIYGEVGLNAFIETETSNTTWSLFNSGIGVKVKL